MRHKFITGQKVRIAQRFRTKFNDDICVIHTITECIIRNGKCAYKTDHGCMFYDNEIEPFIKDTKEENMSNSTITVVKDSAPTGIVLADTTPGTYYRVIRYIHNERAVGVIGIAIARKPGLTVIAGNDEFPAGYFIDNESIMVVPIKHVDIKIEI